MSIILTIDRSYMPNEFVVKKPFKKSRFRRTDLGEYLKSLSLNGYSFWVNTVLKDKVYAVKSKDELPQGVQGNWICPYWFQVPLLFSEEAKPYQRVLLS